MIGAFKLIDVQLSLLMLTPQEATTSIKQSDPKNRGLSVPKQPSPRENPISP